MKLEELQTLVIEWAIQKGILIDVTPERIEKQTLKVLEEIGETAGAYLKGNREELIDGIGDVAVTLIILAEMNCLTLDLNIQAPSAIKPKLILISSLVAINHLELNTHHIEDVKPNLSFAIKELESFAKSQDLTLEDCLESAYNVIAKRTGKMINGTFIKD